MASQGDLLKQYGDAAEVYRAAEEKYNEALQSIDPLKQELDSARSEVAAAVEALGSDPFKILKGSRGGARGPRGPRDPEKRGRVLEAMTGRTVNEIVEAVNEQYGADYVDKPYVNSVITQGRKKGEVESEGERGSKRHTYTPQAVEAPVAA